MLTDWELCPLFTFLVLNPGTPFIAAFIGFTSPGTVILAAALTLPPFIGLGMYNPFMTLTSPGTVPAPFTFAVFV